MPVLLQAVCDGKKVYYYKPEGNLFGRDANEPLPKLTLSMTQAISPSDDPFMPWPHLFVEHLSHPNVWPPTPEREFILDAKPADGPPGTIRLRVRDTRFADPSRPDLHKLWISPAQGYMSLRTETSVFETLNPPKIAFVDTMIMERSTEVAERVLVPRASAPPDLRTSERADLEVPPGIRRSDARRLVSGTEVICRPIESAGASPSTAVPAPLRTPLSHVTDREADLDESGRFLAHFSESIAGTPADMPARYEASLTQQRKMA